MTAYSGGKAHKLSSQEFNRLAKANATPKPYCLTLPGSPAELFTTDPNVYRSIFKQLDAGNRPMRCPLDLIALRSLDGSYRCRGSGPERGYAQVAAAPPPQPLDMSSVAMLMQGFQQMQQMHAFQMQRSGPNCQPSHGVAEQFSKQWIILVNCDLCLRTP